MPPSITLTPSVQQPLPSLTTVTPRIITLLPSLTDVIADLDQVTHLVATTHECHTAKHSVALTAPKLDITSLSQSEIATGWNALAYHPSYQELDSLVCSFYQVDVPRLIDLKPTLLLTHIKNNEWGETEQNVIAMLQEFIPGICVISANPTSVEQIFHLYNRVGAALNIEVNTITNAWRKRLQALCRPIKPIIQKSTVAFVQWAEPLYLAADWVSEVLPPSLQPHPVTISPAPSVRAEVEDLRRCDIIIFSICAMNLQECTKIVDDFWSNYSQCLSGWQGRIVAADAHMCFSRFSLSSVVTTAEVIRQISFGDGRYRGRLWEEWKRA